ncbi:restriction endonuclease [Natranaerovirga hydrolytica]|uniref:Restriction endonuclease n=1 Tax=Natranaerovirga hydrolytica TaxID=680378 RepID=A0A4R1MDK3_9FIRM|nr:restriction endonuclease [Natranaerovirga hydrolytica]TCK89114.1 restriction endonuclease [Natranaerovirga hydrolytica]
MIFAAIIENDSENEVLLCKSINANGQITWTLPCCDSIDDILQGCDDLVQKCRDEYDISIGIETSSICFESSDCIVYRVSLLSYTSFSNTKEKDYRWLKTDALRSINLSEMFFPVFDSMLKRYERLAYIRKTIKEVINDVSSNFEDYYNTDIQEQKNAINVFIKYPQHVFCPFVFRIDFSLDDTEQMQFVTSISVTRMPDEGDKTDLYVLFSSYMAIIQKLFGNKNVYIDYLSLFDEVEINNASLILLSGLRQFGPSGTEAFKSALQEDFLRFTMSLFTFAELIGSFFTELDEDCYCKEYLDYLCSTDASYNCQARKEVQYYYNAVKGISMLRISNAEYRDDFFNALTWEMIDGVDGKILCQINTDNGYLSFNFVSNECWDKISQVIDDMHISKYTFICQSNYLFMFEGKNIWIFEGDFSEYWVAEEKKKLLDRQNRERIILHLNRQFKWRYPINYTRFEELIADLYEREELVQNIKLLGRSNCPDGGRDLLIWKIERKGESSFGSKLIIGQCKAYNRSINKSDVTDIRDTIEHYDATGFYLFTSSALTVPLIDNLVKLKEKYESDWWTEREIFKKLRQHSDVADRYSDILEIDEVSSSSMNEKAVTV